MYKRQISHRISAYFDDAYLLTETYPTVSEAATEYGVSNRTVQLATKGWDPSTVMSSKMPRSSMTSRASAHRMIASVLSDTFHRLTMRILLSMRSQGQRGDETGWPEPIIGNVVGFMKYVLPRDVFELRFRHVQRISVKRGICDTVSMLHIKIM